MLGAATLRPHRALNANARLRWNKPPPRRARHHRRRRSWHLLSPCPCHRPAIQHHPLAIRPCPDHGCHRRCATRRARRDTITLPTPMRLKINVAPKAARTLDPLLIRPIQQGRPKGPRSAMPRAKRDTTTLPKPMRLNINVMLREAHIPRRLPTRRMLLGNGNDHQSASLHVRLY